MIVYLTGVDEQDAMNSTIYQLLTDAVQVAQETEGLTHVWQADFTIDGIVPGSACVLCCPVDDYAVVLFEQ
jgi:hypothetical protein